MIGAILSRVRLALTAIAAGVIAFLVIRLRLQGGRLEDAERRADAAEGYVDTRREIDDAVDDLGNDPDAARRWLRERAAAGEP